MRKLSEQVAIPVLLAAGLLSACTAAPGAPTPDPTVAPAGPTADPNCHGINESVDTPPLTVAALSKFTDSVVIAEVKAIEGGVWNTKDGARPERASGPKFNPGIQTPIELQITETIHGDHGPGAVRVLTQVEPPTASSIPSTMPPESRRARHMPSSCSPAPTRMGSVVRNCP